MGVVVVVLVVGTGVVLSNTISTHSTTSNSSNTASSSNSINLQSASDLEDGKASCTSQNGLPDPSCTPGATNSNVTQDNIYATICVSGWTATVRPPVSYTEPLKIASITDYRYTDQSLSDYEEDHLIPLELGGSPASVYNLWAEPHQGPYGSYQKDALENYLNSQVCDGKMQLAEAQNEIATNWVKYWILYAGSTTSAPQTTAANTTTVSGSLSSVQITYAQNPIVRGSTQTIYITTNPPLPNTPVTVTVTYASGSTQKTFNAQTDSGGKVLVSWTIGASSDPGTFSVIVKFSGQTYSSNFQVDS